MFQAMIFVQESIYQDQIFGKWVSRFVVSDNYDDMFKSDAQIVTDLSLSTEQFRTNIFQLGKVKESLKQEEGSFAMSEFGFKVSTTSIQTVTDKRAFYFCLHASNFRKHRYCATFIYPYGGTFDESDRDFTGKLSSSISGDEKDWVGAVAWDSEIYPESEVDFKAYQFDLSVLKEALLDDPITILDGTEVDSIFDRLTEFDSGNGDLESNFAYKPSYIFGYDGGTGFIKYISPLGTIYDSLQMILDRSAEVLYDLIGSNFTFTILETDLGISVAPISYELKSQTAGPGPNMKSQSIPSSFLQKLYIAPPGSPNHKWNAYISSFLVKPQFGTGYDIHSSNIPDQYRAQESHSFKALGNVTKVLAEIARSLGCVVVTRFNSGTDIEVEFISRNTLASATDVYLYGVTSSSFDTSSIALEKKIEYYAETNRLILEGGPDKEVTGDEKNTHRVQFFDQTSKDYFEALTPTPALEEFRDKIKIDSLSEYKRLLLSTSWPIIQYRYDGGLIQSEPINVGTLYGTSYESTPNADYYNPDDYQTRYNMLTTGIYVETTPLEASQITQLGASTPIWRPATNVVHNVNGKNIRYENLSDYITSLTSSDKVYYENTRKVTIPSWNAFSTDSGGTSPSWKNLKVGKKIPLKIKTLEYDNVLNEWLEVWSPVQTWQIISMERSHEKPETTLELIDESIFSIYGNYESEKPTGAIQGSVTENTLRNGTSDTDISDVWVFECNEIIKSDYAVALRDDGKIEKFEPLKSKHYNKFIGIAKQDGVANDIIRVQVSGIVVLENSTLDVNKSVFVRKTTGTDPNLQQTILQNKTIDEDMIFRLARKPLNERAFRLEAEYMIYE